MLFHWNIRENPSCECGAEKETIQHIVEECPLTKFQQGFSKLHLRGDQEGLFKLVTLDRILNRITEVTSGC
jgi:hypothetical protein